MNAKNEAPTKTSPIIAYFALAYLLSWSIEVPLALSSRGIIPPALPAWTHYLTAYGPMLAAVIVTWAGEGGAGLRQLAARMVMWKVRPVWWLVAVSPLAVGLVVVLVLNAVAGSGIGLADVGEVQFLPPLGIWALPLWLLTFGIGEETGWRGYALPRLQRGRGALLATAILTVFWGLWHVPAFFYLFDPGIAIGWAIGLFAGAIVFTWLFNSSGGSILIVALWHGCFNFMSSSDAGGGMLAAVVSTLVMVWAVLVIVLFKPAALSRAGKVVPALPDTGQ